MKVTPINRAYFAILGGSRRCVWRIGLTSCAAKRPTPNRWVNLLWRVTARREGAVHPARTLRALAVGSTLSGMSIERVTVDDREGGQRLDRLLALHLAT